MMNMGEFPVVVKQAEFGGLLASLRKKKTGTESQVKSTGEIMFMLSAFGMSDRAIACTFDYIYGNDRLVYIMWLDDQLSVQFVEVVD